MNVHIEKTSTDMYRVKIGYNARSLNLDGMDMAELLIDIIKTKGDVEVSYVDMRFDGE